MTKWKDILGGEGVNQDCLARCETPNACLLSGCRRSAIEKMDNLLAHIDGINDERDSVPILLAIRKLWPDLRAMLSQATL